MDHTPDSLARRLTEAYLQYGDDIVRHCRRKVGSAEEAQDLTQEAFLKTWQYLRGGKQIENIKTFLYAVADHLIIDTYRKRNGNGSDVSLEDLQEQGFEPVGDDVRGLEEKMEVKRILLSLPREREQKLLILRYLKGLPPTVIAEMMAMSPNAVAVHVHRTLKRLAQKFVQVGD